ncbi:MAG: 50S ribosomal protein L10 [Mycobacteriales bacterium]
MPEPNTAQPDKVAAVAELTERFRGSSAAVVTEYRGLSTTQLSQLRRALGDTTSYAVVKNTLTRRAAREVGLDQFDDLLSGPTAIAFIEGDPVVAAKGLRTFARDNPDLIIKGGVLDGNAISPDEINRIADLDSREVLLAKMAGALKGSLSNAAGLFQAPIVKVARLVVALQEKRPPADGDAPATPAPASES